MSDLTHESASAKYGELYCYNLSGEECSRQLGVYPAEGLTSAEVSERLKKYGQNVLAEGKKESRWHALLRQYKDYMQIILIGAALLSFFIGNITSAVVLFLLTLFNAVLGLRQESKAEESIKALKNMMKINAKVRRDKQVMEIPADELVPGDIVLFEAGDKVPADGRLLLAATLEVEEAALTGESNPILKDTAAIQGKDVPIGDRINMAFMNSYVTRGRGEMIVTSTGMSTEVGHIAGMLEKTKIEKTPLTRQIDHLTIIIAILAGLALVAIIAIGLFYGESFNTLFNVAVALAVAAIPTGLPLVVTSVLSIGTTELAKRRAIVKRLPSVETLGSTSAICSDKTGTLTLNQMTAREIVIAEQPYKVTGEGYSTEGQIQRVGGVGEVNLDPILLPMALCSDASTKDGELVGDPTEGALIVLAAKGGLNLDATRSQFPRIAEVPFDSAYKFMATFHNMVDNGGRQFVRCYVKGAPDVLVSRSTYGRGKGGKIVPMDETRKKWILAENDRLASQGMRVLMLAQKDFDLKTFSASQNLLGDMNNLTLLAAVGIVDPPRPEAKEAIAKCKSAGIRVRMITGDHAKTAEAIGHELGIEGRAITGAEFREMSNETIAEQMDEIGIVARVSPEDKVRMVAALQSRGEIVAMTGDGVNDAPALKKADIGVAMGISGTEVSKEAAAMILTDDNFATIVGAVEEGRIIYDNLMKYIRFQMANLIALILAFLGAAVFQIGEMALLNPLQILWINFFVMAPIAVALGSDTVTPGLIQQKPRPSKERILSTPLAIRLIVVGSFMAAATLAAYLWANNNYSSIAVSQTMAMMTLTFCQIFASLNLRYHLDTIFRMETLSNPKLFYAIGLVLLLAILVTNLRLPQALFGTASLSKQDWLLCLSAGVSMLALSEIFKFVFKLTGGKRRQVEGSN